MKPEEGGSWFFLAVDNPVHKGLIVDAETALTLTSRDFASELAKDGIMFVADKKGAWESFVFEEDFSPYSTPDSIINLAEYIQIGTVVTLDNGCWPSVEWRFEENGVCVFDTFDCLEE